MAITTAGDIVRAALGKLLVLSSQDTLTSAEVEDGLDALNAMMDSWWNESLAVYQIKQESFPLTAAVGAYTIGSGGTWNTTRPVRITGGFVRYQSVDYQLQILDRPQYDLISYKTNQGIPLALFYDRAYPLGTVTLYPLPQPAGMTIFLDSYLQIQSFANATDLIDLPPGYARALIFNLAVEISADYNKEVPPTVARIAAQSLGTLKRNNRQDVVARFDSAILTGSRAYNYISDTYT